MQGAQKETRRLGFHESWRPSCSKKQSKNIGRHSRDWVAVQTCEQCKHKGAREARDAGRMQEPGDKQAQDSCSKAEVLRLKPPAVATEPRSRDLGSRSKQNCRSKV